MSENQFPKITIRSEIFQDPAFWNEVGLEALATADAIKVRLLRGEGADGSRLREYSRGYGDWKEKETGSRTPNLLLSGQLHKSIVAVTPVNESGAIVGKIEFNGSHSSRLSAAGLAQSLIDRGFKDWNAWSTSDIDRMDDAATETIIKNFPRLVDIT